MTHSIDPAGKSPTSRELSPTYSVVRTDERGCRTVSHFFVGAHELAEYIAGLGPEPVEDRACGVLHPEDSSVMCIPLPNGRTALIDAADYELVKPYAWRTQESGYVVTPHSFHGVIHYICLHRLVLMLGERDDRVGDHVNHDRLDNRKANLRACTLQENLFNARLSAANTSGIKGVYRTPQGWKASIGKDRASFRKTFSTKEEAETWARAKREELHGEFACHG